MSRLEVHHIFPKAQLYKHKFKRPEVNALANFCFLTKDTNLNISARLPEQYFPEVEEAHPGALASQWIPTDPALEDRELPRLPRRAEDAPRGRSQPADGRAAPRRDTLARRPGRRSARTAVRGGITSEAEEEALEELNDWIEAQGLPRGILAYDFADAESGQQEAVFDLAWPNGIQEELSQPVAVLLNETAETLSIASQAGFRCFTEAEDFRRYVQREILSLEVVLMSTVGQIERSPRPASSSCSATSWATSTWATGRIARATLHRDRPALAWLKKRGWTTR